MKKLLIALLLPALVVGLASCGPKKGPKVVNVAFVTNNVSDFWKIAEAGVRQGEKDFKCKCQVEMPVQGTAGEQKRVLEDLVVKGISGVAISPVNPDKVDMLDKAAGQVNLICMDSDAPKSKRLCYVGTSNYDAGKVAAGELMKALPNGGKVMVYVGTMDAQNAADRYKGIADTLKKANSKVKILSIMTDNADHEKARRNVEDTLVKYSDISGLVGLWSYNGPAIYKAVDAAGKSGKVKIVCFDEDPSTLQGVKKGAIFATVVQKPFKFGYESVRLLAALARGDKNAIPANKMVNTGVQVINSDNVDEFSASLNKMLGKK